MTTLLSLDCLKAGYGRQEILKGITLNIPQGEFLGVAGPNGSGKSTLVRAASRSLKPFSGCVKLNGSDIWSLSAKNFARQVAVVPQETTPAFDISALEVVLLGRHPHVGRLHLENRADENIAMQSLEAVGAAHLADKNIREISGGERQRVFIAKALAQQPRLLILDEPTSHLDVAHQTEVMSLVSRLARERGLTVVAVLHDLNLASAWCNRIVVINNGQLEADGTPLDVITESLLARVWKARMWVRHHPTTGRPFLLPMPPPYEQDEEREGSRVHVICGGGSGGQVIGQLIQLGFRVTCGVLNVGDSDEEICRAMNIPHVAEAPFSPISPERYQANLRLAMDSDLIILTDFCIGDGNIGNLEVALEALQAGKTLVRVSDQGEPAQDYSGGRGNKLLSKILTKCVQVNGVSGLSDYLQSHA